MLLGTTVGTFLEPPFGSMTKCRRPVYCFRYFVLFSLFGSIWKHLDTDCFRYFAPF